MSGSRAERLDRLLAGQPIVFGGDRVTYVADTLADAFRPGDRLIVVQETGDLLHVPALAEAAAAQATASAADAFDALAACRDNQITEFFDRFAAVLGDDGRFAPIR